MDLSSLKAGMNNAGLLNNTQEQGLAITLSASGCGGPCAVLCMACTLMLFQY